MLVLVAVYLVALQTGVELVAELLQANLIVHVLPLDDFLLGRVLFCLLVFLELDNLSVVIIHLGFLSALVCVVAVYCRVQLANALLQLTDLGVACVGQSL